MNGITKYLKQMSFTDLKAHMTVESAATMAEDYADWLLKEQIKENKFFKTSEEIKVMAIKNGFDEKDTELWIAAYTQAQDDVLQILTKQNK